MSKVKTALFYLLWCVALAAPITVWLNATGNPFEYITNRAPPGQIYYIFSKLFALLSISLLFLHMLLMLGKKHWHWNVIKHQYLGLCVLLFATLHAGCFVTAKSVRANHFAYDTLIPDFGSGFYKARVSLGVIALVGLTLVAFIGMLRRWQPTQMSYKYLHRVSFLTLTLLIFHFVGIGSDV